MAGLFSACMLAPAAAEPFYGTLDEEVEAFLGSYVYVGDGAGIPSDRIRAALPGCNATRPDAQAPAPYDKGDIAVYRDGASIMIEGERVAGGRDTLTFSDDAGEPINNFAFSGSQNFAVVELAHFHRIDGIWPGAWIKASGRLGGVYATCAAVLDRPAKQPWD